MTGTASPPTRPPLRKRLLADTRPLQESPEYRRLWLGSALSGLGNQMTAVAVPVQVYSLTHSSLAVGSLGLTLSLPLIALGLLGGSFADVLDRRKLVLVTSSFLALVSLLLAAQALANLRQVWLLYALTTMQSALVAIDSPARRTFIPRLLPSDRIAAASALSFLSFHVAMVVGPLTAGVLIAASGFQAAYIIDVVTFTMAIYAVLRLPPMRSEESDASPGVRAVVEGLRFVQHHPIIAMTLIVDMNATLFGMPFALFPALAATHFGGGARTAGILYASPAIGGMLCAAFSGPLSHLQRQGLAIVLAVGMWGAAIACFGLTSSLPLAVLFLAIAGVADVINGVFRTTIVQVNTPDSLQGRVNALGFVVGAGVPKLGDVEAGVVATLTTPVISAVSGGAACVIGVVLLSLASPALRRYDATAARPPPPASQPSS